MATLHVSIAAVRALGPDGATGVVYDGAPIVAESLTTSTTSASTTATGSTTVKARQVARCMAVDSAHYVTTGSAPTASATAGYYVPSGSFIDIAIAPGHKVAARTA